MSKEGFQGPYVTPEDIAKGRVTNPDKAEAMARASNEYRTREAEDRQKKVLSGPALSSFAQDAEASAKETYEKGIGIDSYSTQFSPEMREMVRISTQETQTQAENMSLERLQQEIRLSQERTSILKDIAERRDRDINERMPSKKNLEAEAARLTKEIKDKLDRAA